MDILDKIVPWAPLLNRSIVQFIEEVNTNNARVEEALNYRPRILWRVSVKNAREEMMRKAEGAMSMVKPLVSLLEL